MNLCGYLKHNSIKLTTFSEFSIKMKSIWKNYILSVIRHAYEIVHILFILIILLCSLSVKYFNWHTVETGMKKNSENPVPSCLQQVMEAFFFSHTDIILALNFCAKFNLFLVPGKDICFRMCNSRNRIEYHFGIFVSSLSWFVCQTCFYLKWIIFRIFCLPDQDASLCHLCCYNSFDTPFLWHHL